MGRKKLSFCRNKIFTIRVTEHMHDVIIENANKYGIKGPDVIRQCIEYAFKLDNRAGKIDFKQQERE